MLLSGTFEYLAPELIAGKGYDKGVDVWAVGVMAYEFLVGVAPFSGETEKAMFQQIVDCEVKYPASLAISSEAKDLISCLLEKDPGALTFL
jgi:serine/threonine protein kinase